MLRRIGISKPIFQPNFIPRRAFTLSFEDAKKASEERRKADEAAKKAEEAAKKAGESAKKVRERVEDIYGYDLTPITLAHIGSVYEKPKNNTDTKKPAKQQNNAIVPVFVAGPDTKKSIQQETRAIMAAFVAGVVTGVTVMAPSSPTQPSKHYPTVH